MFGKIQIIAMGGLLLFAMAASFSAYVTYGWYSDVKEELARVELAREKAEENLKLVTEQLDDEQKLRAVTQEALINLKGVPDVDANTPLPDSVGNVLRDFRDRMSPAHD